MTASVPTNKVYRDGSKLLRCTGESPRQFNGILFVTLEGETPESVGESVRTMEQLRGLQDVEISTLSVQWKKALGLPEVEPSPKRQDTRSSSPVIRRGQGATPSRRETQKKQQLVVETRYMKCAPSLGWFSLNLYIGLGLLSIAICGLNPYYLAMIMLLGGFSVAYAAAATFMGGKIKHGQVDRGYFTGH